MTKWSKEFMNFVDQAVNAIDTCKSVKEARKVALKYIAELDLLHLSHAESCIAEATIRTAYFDFEDQQLL